MTLPGAVAQASRGQQRTLSFMKPPTPLTVNKVFDRLTDIAKMTGNQVRPGYEGISAGVRGY